MPLIHLPIPFINSDPPDSRMPHLPATFESPSQNANSSPNYTGLKKIDLVRRLREYNASQVPTAGANTSSSISHGSRGSDSPHSQSALESAVAHDVDELCSSFDRGLSGEGDEDDGDDDGGDDPMVGEADDHDDPGANGTATSQSAAVGSRTPGAKAWVDQFILDSQRKSSQQTEKSVLSLWQRWLTSALAAGIVLDIVVDAHHTIEYLKYAATQSLLTTSGCEQANDQWLSLSSLKKHMTMLGRVRRRQIDDNPALEHMQPAFTAHTMDYYKALMVQAQRLRLDDVNFNITKNTILDSELFPEHFEQITRSILTRLPQLPSIVKAHFSWNWQCTTLTHGDELVNLRLPCIQPYHLFIPDYTTADGRRSGRGSRFFGVLSLYHESKTAKPGKQEPDYNFVLPHRDPLRCPIVALAIFLHYVFDQEDLVSKVAGWDWSCAALWRKINVIFGKQVGEPSTGDAMRKMFSKFLEHTSIRSEKKLHLARRTVPSLMEDVTFSPSPDPRTPLAKTPNTVGRHMQVRFGKDGKTDTKIMHCIPAAKSPDSGHVIIQANKTYEVRT
ncbi:hypothetical protein EDB86DRAFT_3077787 [Lactarius hatsudake]|nr:hypothetical protein EDB86DRAFT_3077787 [Lactarius hatsudake]